MENENLLESYRALAEVMPGVLEEEILMVELKDSDSNDDIKSVMLLTLRNDLCNLDAKPPESEGEYKIWCWNVTRGNWYLLDFEQVESAVNWPPTNE